MDKKIGNSYVALVAKAGNCDLRVRFFISIYTAYSKICSVIVNGQKNRQQLCCLSCEGWDRTSDLRVMSPTSYRCSTSRCKSTVKSIMFKTIFTVLPLLQTCVQVL